MEERTAESLLAPCEAAYFHQPLERQLCTYSSFRRNEVTVDAVLKGVDGSAPVTPA